MVCDSVMIGKGDKVCAKCRAALPVLKGNRCLMCGKEIPEDEEFCPDCLEGGHSFEKVYAIWNYDDAMSASIARFKYHGRQEYAQFYAEEILKTYGDVFKETGFDAVIPVPVHGARRALRGYNQAELVAKYIAAELNVPLVTDLLIRTVNTKPQKELTPKERAKNLSSAFGINKKSKSYDIYLEKVLLVDDIYTTGSTADACSKTLIGAGAGSIYVCCMCVARGSV